LVGFLPVISSNLRVGKGRLRGFSGFHHHREPVGAFGWYPIAAIGVFPGGRLWLVSGRFGPFAGYVSLAWRNGVGLC
jgi:hypothetical protein